MFPPRFRSRALAVLGAVPATAVPVTLGAGGGAAAPRASARQVAFVRQGGAGPASVWVAPLVAGGSAHRLASGGAPLISPNGEIVAISVNGSRGPALRLYPSGGGKPHGFFDLSKASAYPAAWSADSRYLAVELSGTSVHGTAGSGLALIDTRTLSSRMLAGGSIEGVSFAPGDHRLVYASTRSPQPGTAVNLHTIGLDGSRPRQITSDGRSFSPVWTRFGIIYTRATLRGVSRAPAYQLWLARGSRRIQLTHMRIPPLLDGLQAVTPAARGGRLLARYVGEDTDEAWTVQLKPLRIRRLLVAGKPVQGYAISRDGRSLLVDVGGFEQPASDGTVEVVGFAGGPPVRLYRGDQPSWDR